MASMDLAMLNKSGNKCRKFEEVKDNQVSTIRTIIGEAMERLGGINSELLQEKNVGKMLVTVQSELEHTYLDLSDAADLSTDNIKLKKCNSNEHTALKDLNKALLLTHADYLGPIYYHRGMTLTAWGKYEEATVDFEQALVFQFKGRELYKLYHKLAQCYQKTKKFSRSVECLEKAVENIKSAKLNDKQKKQHVKILKESIEKISHKKDAPKEITKNLSKVTEPHTTDPRLSNLIRIKTSAEKGRHAVAREDIPVGTILMSDEGMNPFLNPDDKENATKFCLVCLKNVDSLPFPCLSCARVVYCSPTCQQKGAAQFHNYQCQLDIYNIRQKDTKDWCRIFSTLNIILAKPLSFWIANQKEFLEKKSSTNIDSEGLPSQALDEIDRYLQLFDMVTHEDTIPVDVRAKHALVVVFHLRSLRKTDYYSKHNLKIKTKTNEFLEEELLIGKLIFKLRLISEANLYPVWGVEEEGAGQVAIENIGSGIFPSIGSCLNSSCSPNTIRVNRGHKVLVVAAQDIAKGEEITDNYCIHYSELPVEERKEWLKETFQFECSCQACLHDWPVFDQMKTDMPTEIKEQVAAIEKENAEALRFVNIDSRVS